MVEFVICPVQVHQNLPVYHIILVQGKLCKNPGRSVKLGGFPAHLSFDCILGRASTEAEVNGCLVSAGFTVMKRAGEPSQLCRESADALFVAINARDSAHDQIH